MQSQHTTVLLHEAVDALLNSADVGGEEPRVFVDATFGRGGHSRLIVERLRGADRLEVYDKDLEAIAVANQLASVEKRVTVHHAGFAALQSRPTQSLSGVLMDLGISSPQIDTAERGFSFRFDAPLDMRMDTTRGQTAAQWLSTATVQHMTEVIRDYGEERFAVQIAKAIDARRQSGKPVCSTGELAELVAGAVKTREPGQNPATRTFQAIRIYINAELEELQQALNACLRVLRPGASLVVISFHSLEDRIVKQFIAAHSKEHYDRRAPFAVAAPTLLQALGRTKPPEDRVRANPRARSAVMRVARRTLAPLQGVFA